MSLNESIVEDAKKRVKSKIPESISYFIFYPSLFFYQAAKLGHSRGRT